MRRIDKHWSPVDQMAERRRVAKWDAIYWTLTFVFGLALLHLLGNGWWWW